MNLYLVGQNRRPIEASSPAMAYRLYCWTHPKTCVPVTDPESNETRYFSRTLTRAGNVRTICEHKSMNGKIIAIGY